MNKFLALLILLAFVVACSQPDKEKYIARYGDHFLTREEVSAMLPADVSKVDSANRVEAIIQEWARKQAMFERAGDNLTQAEKDGMEKNIEKYRADLWINAYSKLLISKILDTVVTDLQMNEYFEKNRKTFVLKENVVQYRFATFLPSEPELASAKNWIKSNKASDISQLEDLCIQKALDYNLNDSVWTKISELKQRIGGASLTNKSFPANTYQEIKDSSDITLLYITNSKFAAEDMPMDYAKDIIKENILNKRKLDILKDASQELLDEATKDKDFEIYSNEKKK